MDGSLYRKIDAVWYGDGLVEHSSSMHSSRNKGKAGTVQSFNDGSMYEDTKHKAFFVSTEV